MKRIIWISGVLLLLCSWTSWGADLHIIVQQGAMVQGPEITIGDLAEVQGADPSIVEKVKRIVIGQAPPAGEDRFLPGGYIYTRLKQYGFDPQTLEIQVPEKIQVTRVSQRIEARAIEAAVRKALKAQMAWDPEKTTIREIRGLESVILPPGPVHYEVSFPNSTDFLGPTSFSITFRVHGNVEKQMYGTAYIEVLLEVVTLTRPIAKDELIEAGDIRLKRVNLAQIPRGVITNAEEVIGRRAKRPLQMNAMIRTYEIETLSLMQRGDQVIILVESPLLKITAMGEALERGNRGETIRVRNLSSQKELRAVVVDGKTVRVTF
jgi:flagella basal body P-ring formation protein FlgA